MIKKINQIINEFRVRQQFIEAQTKELEWADIFHDTIKGRKWLEDLALSPGRWAGNYSFFFVLARILSEYKPKNILEFGLGESTKMVSAFLKNELQTSKHIVVEHNQDWIHAFHERYQLASNSSIALHKHVVKSIRGFESNSYENVELYSEQIMDLYIVDGISSQRFSRNYIINVLEKVSEKNDFMVIIDDYSRQGEQDTAGELLTMLKEKNINTHTGYYSGNKSQIIITTEKYRFSTSL